jgi:hypothetical protein
LKYDTSTCGGLSKHLEVDITPVADPSYDTCAAACTALGEECQEFVFDSVLLTCAAYTGFCSSEVSTDSKVYERVQCCYWTTPL